MVKPMGKLTSPQGNAILDQSIQLFNKFNFTKSSNEVVGIKNELNGTKNFGILNSTFKVLQTTFIVEYNTTTHRTLCSTFFKKRVNLTTKFNTAGLNNIHLDMAWAKMIEYRVKSRNVLFILDWYTFRSCTLRNCDYDPKSASLMGFNFIRNAIHVV